MNNLTFGNDQYQYYETICSGSPAGPGFDGTPACHVHMTNSRLTDPEVLEYRFPVLLEDFHIRRAPAARASGTRATAPAARSASSRRWNAPSSPSHRQRAAVRHRGRRARRGGPQPACGGWTGASTSSPACDQTVLEAGEAVTVITPTGGGFGKAG